MSTTVLVDVCEHNPTKCLGCRLGKTVVDFVWCAGYLTFFFSWITHLAVCSILLTITFLHAFFFFELFIVGWYHTLIMAYSVIPHVSAQPVHDELEYIKMRYRSPARSSFRDQKAYETLTTQLGSTYSSTERGLEGYSDDSADRYPASTPGSQGKNSHRHGRDTSSAGRGSRDGDHAQRDRAMPWVRVSPSTHAPNMPDLGIAYHSSQPLPAPPTGVYQGQYSVGQAPGVTVI